jgi:ClpP class serine protease
MSEVWAITAEGFAEAVALIRAGVTVSYDAEGAPQGERVYVRGPLTREASPFSRLLGASTYQGLAAQVRALVDGGARALVLDIDSPGGMVQGAHDLAALIAGLGIPTTAEVRGSACSAAYWLASACDRILATPDAVLGSVGAMVPGPTVRDGDGVAVASLSPRKGRADDPQWQELADDAAALMLADIASWRGLASAADVSAAYGGGAVVSGVRAVALGLADGFLTAPDEEGPMPKSRPAPAAARAEAPPARTPEEYEATIAELMGKIAEFEGKLAEKAEPKEEDEEMPAEEAEPKEEDEEMPAEAQALALAHGGAPRALVALASRVGELETQVRASAEAARLAARDHELGVAIAEGRISPADREVAETLYDARPELYRSRYGSRPAGTAVPLGRVSHGAGGDAPTKLHDRVVAHCRAAKLDPNKPTDYRAALAALEA